jgi:hypothetical protein
LSTTDEADLPPDLFAQVQAEAATTWRSPATPTANPVRGSDRLQSGRPGAANSRRRSTVGSTQIPLVFPGLLGALLAVALGPKPGR